jgi:hypothetical protein
MAKKAKPGIDWKERRLYARSHVVWSGRLRVGADEQDCVILDFSATGAMVRLPDPDPQRANVTVSADHFGELRGRVVWQRDNVVGLRFAERPQQVARAVGETAPGLRLAS